MKINNKSTSGQFKWNIRFSVQIYGSAILCLFTSALTAQVAPASDGAMLAKYDLNKNGRLDPDEIDAMERAHRTVQVVQTASGIEGDTMVLSPFEVTASDRGYYASNAMSGTRLNTRLEDLASSISVVTKQQMSDFALLDINDVFAYEASTEGTYTYTDVVSNSDGVPVNNVQLDPNNANRVRGISPANQMFGNFPTSGSVPVDPINIEAIEISRGPNSNIFGLGNPGGTINLQPSTANLQRNRTQVAIRSDTFDGWRTSIDLNRVLKKDFLAIRGSAVFQHDGFHLKPSGTDTARLNGMVKFQPFKYTTVTASYSYYRLTGNRPNVTTPLDGVSLWASSGRPTWDPITGRVHLNGNTLGPYTPTTLPSYFATTSSIRTYSTMAVDRSGQISAWMPVQMTNSAIDPNASKQNVFFVITSPEILRTAQPLWASNSSISDKSIYDWSKINISAPNWLRQENNTTLVNLQQIFLNSARQQLAFEAGYYREDGQNYQRNIIGRAGSSGRIAYLNMDVNERLPTGQPNPFFMKPFIGISAPQNFDLPLRNKMGRGQLAYRIDLRNENTWLRWLGMHRLVAYKEYQDRIQRRVGYRDTILDDHSWLQDIPRATINAAQGGGSDISRIYYRYYVGDNGPRVEYPPERYSYGNYPYTWGNGLTGVMHNETAVFGQGIAADSTAASGNTRQVIKTQGAMWQSFLLKDRLVTTLGIRRDVNSNKLGVTPVFHGADLDWDSWNSWDAGDWNTNKGTTKTAGVVVKPLPWLHFHANTSDSFQPTSFSYNIFLEPLPDPQGKGKDYGFTLVLFDNKLIAKFNHYETKSINSRAGGTAAARVRAMDFEVSTSTNRGNKLSTSASQWVTDAAAAAGQTLTQDQINARVAAIMGFSVQEYLAQISVPNSQISETADVLAKGDEFELNYNPTDNWILKLNLVKQESINIHLSPSIQAWIEKRMPVWTSVKEPSGALWYNTIHTAQGATFTPSFFMTRDVLTPLSVDKALEGKSKPQVRRYKFNASTSYRLAGISDNKILKRITIGGAIRWEDKGAINFYGVQQLPATVTELDVNRPIWDKAHTYVDAFISYRTKLFNDKVGATFQINGRNLQENGRLQATNAYPDGTPWTYRIVDPRQFIFSATFDL